MSRVLDSRGRNGTKRGKLRELLTHFALLLLVGWLATARHYEQTCRNGITHKKCFCNFTKYTQQQQQQEEESAQGNAFNGSSSINISSIKKSSFNVVLNNNKKCSNNISLEIS